jgi:hypothetical protein
MAQNTQQRSAKSAAKAVRFEEEELRHRVRPGIRKMVSDLMRWHDIGQISEAMQLLIMNAHDLGPEGSAHLLAVPRHVYEIPKNVARQLSEFVAPDEPE